MSIVATLEEIANDVGFKDKRAFAMLKGIRDKSPQEQAAIAQSLIDEGLLLSGSVGALQYEIDAITEAESDAEEVGTASELPVAETTAKDLENAKETTTPTEDKPKTFGDQIAESKTLRAFFPRTYERLDRGETGVIGAGLAGALDLPSSIGRGGVAFGKLISGNLDAEKGESFLGEMGKIKPDDASGFGGTVEDILRSPLTPASLATGGIAGMAASKLAPAAAGIGSRVLRGTIGGVAGGVAASAPVSIGQMALGELTPEQAAEQAAYATAGGGVIGGAFPLVGAGIRKVFGTPKLKAEPVQGGRPLDEDIATREYRPLGSLLPTETAERLGLPAETAERLGLPASIDNAQITPNARSIDMQFDPYKQSLAKAGAEKGAKQEDILNAMVGEKLGIPTKEVSQNLPSYMKTVAVNMDDADRSMLSRFFDLEMRAKHAGSAGDLTTAMQYASQDIGSGVKALKEVRSGAGARMGEIEKAASTGDLDKVDVLSSWMDTFGKRGLQIAQNEDGQILVQKMQSGSKLGESDIKDLQKLVDAVVGENNFSRKITPEQLRNLELALKSEFGRNTITGTTRQGTMKTNADAVLDDAFNVLRDQTRENIRKQLGDEAGAEYDRVRKAYAKISGDMDYLQRRLGKEVQNEVAVPWNDDLETMVISARGAGMANRLFEGISDNHAAGLVQAIKQITGKDVYKNAALAKYAAEVVGSKRGGQAHSPASKLSVKGLIDVIKPKPATIGETFDKLTKIREKPTTIGGKAKQAYSDASGRTGDPQGKAKMTIGKLAGMAAQDPNARMRGTSLTPAEIIQRDLERRNALLNSKKK